MKAHPSSKCSEKPRASWGLPPELRPGTKPYLVRVRISRMRMCLPVDAQEYRTFGAA